MGKREKNIGQIRNLTDFRLSFAHAVKRAADDAILEWIGQRVSIYAIFVSPLPPRIARDATCWLKMVTKQGIETILQSQWE